MYDPDEAINELYKENEALKRKIIEASFLIAPCVQQLQDSIRKGDLVLNDYLTSMVEQIAHGNTLLTVKEQER